MNRKLLDFENNLIKKDTFQLGPYTVAEVETKDGIKGYGLAVKSFLDKQNTDLGCSIALGRAIKSAYNKVNKPKSRKQTIFIR